MIEQKGVKFFGPKAPVDNRTLEQVRRERDHLSVVSVEVLSLGGEVREIELTGILPGEATPAEVILELRKTLRIAPEKTVLLTSVSDFSEPILRSNAARKATVTALVLDKELASPVTAQYENEFNQDDLQNSVSTSSCSLRVFILPRAVENESVPGGALMGTTARANLFGGRSDSTYGARRLARELFQAPDTKPKVIGTFTDYVIFFVLPETFQMGQLPLADHNNKEYWEDQAVFTLLFVPKELV